MRNLFTCKICAEISDGIVVHDRVKLNRNLYVKTPQ